jgi:hypothetical protein
VSSVGVGSRFEKARAVGRRFRLLMYNDMAAEMKKTMTTPPMTIPVKAPLETGNGE